MPQTVITIAYAFSKLSNKLHLKAYGWRCDNVMFAEDLVEDIEETMMKHTLSDGALDVPSFDELKALAKNDPSAFDALKKQLCEQLIQSASSDMQPRLRAQQSHIDRVVSRCKNPHHTNVVLMRELQKQVAKFRDALNQPSLYRSGHHHSGCHHSSNQNQNAADHNVVNFPDPQGNSSSRHRHS